MSNETEAKAFSVGMVIGIFVCFIISAFISAILQYQNIERGYIDACRDFYDGKLKYELKELPGGEKLWVRKEKE